MAHSYQTSRISPGEEQENTDESSNELSDLVLRNGSKKLGCIALAVLAVAIAVGSSIWFWGYFIPSEFCRFPQFSELKLVDNF